MHPPESLHRPLIAEEVRTPTGKSGADDHHDDNQKTYLDVLGICCPSEVPLIERLLERLDGVVTVSIIVPSKTVIVIHNPRLVSQFEIVKALNQARLEATVRAYGDSAAVASKFRIWPNPYTLTCGGLLLLSCLYPLYDPLKWLAVLASVAGIPPVLLKCFAAARNWTLDINILMLLVVAGSFALGDFWEAGTVVFLFTIAGWLESKATYKASEVMASVLSMAPKKAMLADSGVVVDARDVKINTVLAVKAGEVVPIDGVVVQGSCEVDESSLTGESFPVSKHPQSLVWAGTNNINGYINLRSTALASDSTVAKMTNLVEEAQKSKSRINRLIDSCAKYYTPIVFLGATSVAVIPVAVGVDDRRYWFHLALILLVSACPCSLVISTPVATFCGLSTAAAAGVLIKGGDYLEALAKTKVVAFDKTGTLTTGDFIVKDFWPVTKHGITVDTILYWVSSLESKSNHPMATALVDYAKSRSIHPRSDDVVGFQSFPGEGIYGEIDRKSIHVGNGKIGFRAGCRTFPSVPEETRRGVSVGYVFCGADLIGVFSLSDSCRSGAAEGIRELKDMGIKTIMLTGDTTEAAAFISKQLGDNAMDSVHADLLPENKVWILNDLRSKSEGSSTMVMVGDGMNDAPALTAADVGISMGISGSAVAMETSHITLMSNDVQKIPQVIRLAKKTFWKILQNMVLSVVIKGSILALAFAGRPILWVAVLADVGTCLLVIINSMILLQTTGKTGKGQEDYSSPSFSCRRKRGGVPVAANPVEKSDGGEVSGSISSSQEDGEKSGDVKQGSCAKGCCGSGMKNNLTEIITVEY